MKKYPINWTIRRVASQLSSTTVAIANMISREDSKDRIISVQLSCDQCFYILCVQEEVDGALGQYETICTTTSQYHGEGRRRLLIRRWSPDMTPPGRWVVRVSRIAHGREGRHRTYNGMLMTDWLHWCIEYNRHRFASRRISLPPCLINKMQI